MASRISVITAALGGRASRRANTRWPVFVLGNQQPLIRVCERDDRVVIRTAHGFGDGNDFVPCAPQFDDYRKITALVSDETHGR